MQNKIVTILHTDEEIYCSFTNGIIVKEPMRKNYVVKVKLKHRFLI